MREEEEGCPVYRLLLEDFRVVIAVWGVPEKAHHLGNAPSTDVRRKVWEDRGIGSQQYDKLS